MHIPQAVAYVRHGVETIDACQLYEFVEVAVIELEALLVALVLDIVEVLLVLQVVLRLVVDAFGQMRTVENRLEKHLAPVALHFRVAFQRAGQVIGPLGHAQVRLAEPTNFRFE